LQFFSACSMAYSHGSNDAQKSMGVIALALTGFLAEGHDRGALPAWVFPAKSGDVPMWVIISCAIAIGLGTMAGGMRIIKTMGNKIIRITPLQGFAAETTAAIILQVTARLGIPVSTTHCISACIMGVGASKRASAVRWGVAGNIVVAWVLTLPAAGAVAALVLFVFKLFATK
jgi:PiT family inorganic phosphate transporter